VRVGLERMQARRGAVDRFEIESAQFFDRVRNRYLELARAAPQRFRVIDATARLDQVCESALVALEGALGLAPAAAS
jgi:dTMP kinase